MGHTQINNNQEGKCSPIEFCLVTLIASVVLLTAGIGPRFTGIAYTRTTAQAGETFLYTGSLADESGRLVADGIYDFTFALYDAETGGIPLWSETQQGVMVKAGTFATSLGSVNPIPKDMLDSCKRWLAVSVRGPGDAAFTLLAPRQKLGAAVPESTTAPSAGLACAHTHLYENWVGSVPGYALRVENTSTGDAIRGISYSTAIDYAGVVGASYASGGTGVYGLGYMGGFGVYASNTGGGRNQTALRADNTNTGNGMAAYITNNSGYHTAHFSNAGSGGVLYLQNGGDANGNGGNDFITAMNKAENDPQFKVLSSGEVRSDVGFNTPASDFAEMLPAVEGLEPGDVLIIGADGKLARSTEPYQASVVGVYSTQPGFVGGHPVQGKILGTIPLAVVGIIPVKISAENGAIVPGDMLVASSMPGRAMKAGAHPPQGVVIGKALESSGKDTGMIQMLAALH